MQVKSYIAFTILFGWSSKRLPTCNLAQITCLT